MSFVQDVDEEEEESVVDWGVKTVLDASEEGLLNESGALSTSFASPFAEAIKRVVVETLADILLEKDPKSDIASGSDCFLG
jgi:hypothetical protein